MDQSINIIYATQTGNAQYIAHLINQQLIDQGLSSKCIAIDDFNVQDLPNLQLILFVISTTGDGHVPNMMQHFFQFLLIKSIPKNALQNLQFSVFGLGDSSYAQFNVAARKLNARLLQLSAKSISTIGLGDDQDELGYETQFNIWGDETFKALSKIINKQIQFQSNYTYKQPLYKITQQPTQKQLTLNNIWQQEKQFEEFVIEDIKTSECNGKICKFITLKNNQKYSPGDILKIMPQNTNYQQLLKNFPDINLQQTYIQSQDQSQILLVDALQSYFDINSKVTRNLIKQLIPHCQDPILQKGLAKMTGSNAQDYQDYYDYVVKLQRKIWEIFHDFEITNLPLETLLTYFQPIHSRSYSISSYSDDKIMLTIVLYIKTFNKNRVMKGLCSEYIESLQINDTIKAKICKGSYQFPSQINQPILLIATGSGIAPIMSYLFWKEKNQKSDDESHCILLFGNQNVDKDFYFKEDLTRMKQNNIIQELHTAFSRDNQEKKYVQHVLKDQINIKRFIESPGIIYICGSMNMCKDVQKTLVQMSNEETIKQIKQTGRLITEFW